MLTSMGFGRTDITPPLGTPLRGYYHERLAAGVLDPLYARAIVWGEGPDVVVIITCDLCMIDASWGDQARQLAARAAGVSADCVLLNATHTHLAPESTPEIAGQLPAQVEQAVRMAVTNRAPCHVRQGHSQVPGISFNRRYWMRDGSVQTNPLGKESQIDRPAGPVNDRLGVLSFEDKSGRVRGLLTHFALHADTIGDCHVSADWPGLIESHLRTARGHQALHVQLLIGPCGDVNHFDFMGRHAVKEIAEAQGIVRALAAGIDRAFTQMTEAAFKKPQASVGGALVPVFQPTSAEIQAATKRLAGHKDDPNADFVLEIVAAKKTLKAAPLKGEPVRLGLQAFDFGSWALLAIPMEVFVEVGSEITRGLSKEVWIVTLANGYHGYLPSPGAFREGGYEVASSILKPAAPERLISAARELLSR